MEVREGVFTQQLPRKLSKEGRPSKNLNFSGRENSKGERGEKKKGDRELGPTPKDTL